MQMRPSIAPINRFKHLPITPTAFHSRAQRRATHAGSPIAPMIEPQRGSLFLSISTQCAPRDTGLWSGTALQFFEVWPSLMCFPVLCSRGPTRQPHRNRGVKPLLQLKTTIFRSGSVLKWQTSCLCLTARRQGEMSALLSLNSAH